MGTRFFWTCGKSQRTNGWLGGVVLGSGAILLKRFGAKEAPLRVAPTAPITGGVCVDTQGWTRVLGSFMPPVK